MVYVLLTSKGLDSDIDRFISDAFSRGSVQNGGPDSHTAPQTASDYFWQTVEEEGEKGGKGEGKEEREKRRGE